MTVRDISVNNKYIIVDICYAKGGVGFFSTVGLASPFASVVCYFPASPTKQSIKKKIKGVIPPYGFHSARISNLVFACVSRYLLQSSLLQLSISRL